MFSCPAYREAISASLEHAQAMATRGRILCSACDVIVVIIHVIYVNKTRRSSDQDTVGMTNTKTAESCLATSVEASHLSNIHVPKFHRDSLFSKNVRSLMLLLGIKHKDSEILAVCLDSDCQLTGAVRGVKTKVRTGVKMRVWPWPRNDYVPRVISRIVTS